MHRVLTCGARSIRFPAMKFSNFFMFVAAVLGVFLSSQIFAIGTSSPKPTRLVTHSALPMVDDVRVTILGDMTVSRWTHGEWGFSALVEVKIAGVWKKILFDTGAEPSTVAFNIERLAVAQKIKDANGKPISVCDAEAVVLSHNHQDHTMGLVELRRRCGNGSALATAYVGGPEIFWNRPYHGDSSIGRNDDNVMLAGNGIAKALGLNPEYDTYGVKQLYESSGGRFEVPQKHEPVALDGFPGVWATGFIPRVFDEKTFPGKPNIVDPATGQAALDKVPEDQALVINTSKGLVVITGCSHAGVVNTVLYAQKMLGQTLPIYALLGGYHLFQEKVGDTNTPGTLAWAAAQLAGNNFGIKYLLGAHCTGLEAFAFLRTAMGLDAKHAVYSTIATTFDLTAGIVPPAAGLNRTPEQLSRNK
jgi:7,8-dihydropterin-6-yl-methyl-4-(beta-D-ribofuranosyl)aminobenzene 5'-phosphate synthase